jgi:hypothetical protein
VNRVSYNGGNGGINARPRPEEEAAAREKHIPPVAVQTQHAQAARANPQQRVSVNQGKPAIAATPKPGALNDRAAVPAKEAGAPYNPAVNKAAENKAAENKAAENKAAERSTPAPRNDVARPPSSSEKASTPRPVENAAQRESIPRTENAPHPAAAPPPEEKVKAEKAKAEKPAQAPEGEEHPRQ